MGCGCSKGAGHSRGAVAPAPEDREQPGDAPGGLPSGPAKRRGSVSAEPSGVSHSLSVAAGRQSVANQKALGTRERIRAIVKSTLLLKGLDEEQQGLVIDAMEERRVAAGEVIIRQGEEGDSLYVVESGRFRATKDGAEVATYDGAGAFGELALMYNCPRAATVTALSDGVLWALDRATFRALVVGSMAERAQRYQASLRRIPCLQHLTQEQLAAIADCLEQESFEPGEYILWEGAPLDDSAKFYMIESGRVDCFRTFEGQKRAVKGLRAGDVFGEVALLTKAPRQADCVAATPCKCLTLSRAAFQRLMGPVEQVLAQQIAQYQASNAEMTGGIATTGSGSGSSSPQAGAPAAAGIGGSVDHAESSTEAASQPLQPASAGAGKPAGRRTASPSSHAASGSAAALLPGSPRPSMLSDGSGSGSFSRKRSSPRATNNSLGARSARSTTNSDSAPAGEGETALGAAAAGYGSGSEAAELQAALDEAAALAEQEPVCQLPPIAEEPAEGATPRTSNASTQGSLMDKQLGRQDCRSTAGSSGKGGADAARRRTSSGGGASGKGKGAGGKPVAGKSTSAKPKPKAPGSKSA